MEWDSGKICEGAFVRRGDPTADFGGAVLVEPDDVSRRARQAAGSEMVSNQRIVPPGRCACRNPRPYWSGGVVVLVEDAAQPLSSGACCTM